MNLHTSTYINIIMYTFIYQNIWISKLQWHLSPESNVKVYWAQLSINICHTYYILTELKVNWLNLMLSWFILLWMYNSMETIICLIYNNVGLIFILYYLYSLWNYKTNDLIIALVNSLTQVHMPRVQKNCN